MNTTTITPGENGLNKYILRHPSGAEAQIYLNGAHITSWKHPDFGELLFLSRDAEFKSGRSIRGGVPIIFPQFGSGELPAHGFARSKEWSFLSSETTRSGGVKAVFSLEDSAETRKIWPYRFKADLEVTLGEALETNLIVTNKDDKPFSFQEALHTYFKISDIHKVHVQGLKGLSYIDKLNNFSLTPENNERLTFNGALDRIYLSSPQVVELHDPGLRRKIKVEKENMADSVLWNPWQEGNQTMKDLHANSYLEMICIESGNIDPKIELQPAITHVARQVLKVESL